MAKRKPKLTAALSRAVRSFKDVQTKGKLARRSQAVFTFQVKRGKWDRDWRWSLVEENGQIVADGSEGYRRRVDAVTEIENIKARIGSAKIRVLR